MRFLMAVICVLLALGVSQPAPLPDDPALDKPVTLEIEGEALTDIMDILEEQTGVRLQVSRRVADQKATIFVDDMPVRQVMAGLATLFGYRWSTKTIQEHKVYELWQDERSRREQESGLREAWARAWAELDGEMRRRAAMPDMITRFADAHLYCSFPSAVLEAYKAGMTICYHSKTDEPEWKLPDHIVQDIRAMGEHTHATIYEMDKVSHSKTDRVESGPSGEFRDAGIMMRALATSTRLEAYMSQDLRFENHACGEETRTLSIRIEGLIPKSKDTLPHEPNDKVLDKQVDFDSAEIATNPIIPELRTPDAPFLLSRSDVLGLLHEKLGLQIISDHYSQWYSCTLKGRPTARDILSGFQRLDTFKSWQCDSIGANWGWDGRFVYMRTDSICMSDAAEIPNRLLCPWQVAYATRGGYTLDELAQMASLRGEQQARLQRVGWLLRLASSERDMVLPSDASALRFYGLLSAAQREAACGRGTHLANLTGEQYAMLKNMFTPSRPTWRLATEEGYLPLPIVGIYSEGWRVDKPGPALSTDFPSVLLVVRRGAASEKFSLVEFLGSDEHRRDIKATTVDEAWKKAIQQYPNAKPGILLQEKTMPYSMAILRPDGISREYAVDLHETTVCPKPAVP